MANTKICADLTGMELRDIIDNLVSANGQTTIAAKMDIDPSILSRFRSGQGALSMAHLNKLFELAGVLLIQRETYTQERQQWMMELRKTEDALLIMSRRLPRPGEYKSWRRAVLERDGRACVECGSKQDLHVHHIVPVTVSPKESTAPDNGVTLCKGCHKKVHK